MIAKKVRTLARNFVRVASVVAQVLYHCLYVEAFSKKAKSRKCLSI